MSGGVDSSVVALGLLRDKYEVVGVTLSMGRRCDGVVVEDVEKVAKYLGIEYKILNVENQFKNEVVDYFVNSYLDGETPNPCAVCNRLIKFKSVIDFMKEIKADFVATGHYANIIENSGKYELHKAKCLTKDQSYFLSTLDYSYLKYIKFPVGYKNDKNEVRKFAEKFGLPVANKKDSQDVCFVDSNYKDFLLNYVKIKAKKGYIKHINGEILGEHSGILNYTIGQRRGLNISYSKPLYVVNFDVHNNIVYVGENEDLFSNELVIKNLNFLDNLEDKNYTIKLRSTHKGQGGKVKLVDENKAKIILCEKSRAITKGQLCCIYDGDKVVGSGWIC